MYIVNVYVGIGIWIESYQRVLCDQVDSLDKLSFTGLFFWKSNIPIAIQLSSSVYNATTFKANYLYTHVQNIRTEHQGNIKGKVRAHKDMNVQEKQEGENKQEIQRKIKSKVTDGLNAP